MHIDFLQRGFRAFVDLNPCSHVLSFGIERLQEEINLHGYVWGKVVSVAVSYAQKQRLVNSKSG